MSSISLLLCAFLGQGGESEIKPFRFVKEKDGERLRASNIVGCLAVLGNKIAFCDGVGEVFFGDPDKEVTRIARVDRSPLGSALSADAKWMGIACSSGRVFLVDMEAEALVHQWQARHSGGSPKAIAFAPATSEVLTAGGGGFIHFFDIETTKQKRTIDAFLREPERAQIFCMAVSPDGKMLAVGQNLVHFANVFDLKTGLPVFSLAHGREVADCAFSPDGRFLATISYMEPRKICVWETFSGQIRMEIDAGAACSRLAWHPSLPLLAAGGIHTDLRSAVDGRVIDSWSAHKKGTRSTVTSLAFAANGKHLYSAGQDFSVFRKPLDLDELKEKLKVAPRADSLENLAAVLRKKNDKNVSIAIEMLAREDRAPAFLKDFVKKMKFEPVPEARLKELVALVDDADEDKAARAGAELRKMGKRIAPTLPKLESTLKTQTGKRALTLLQVELRPSDDEVQLLRIIEVLERIASPAAVETLEWLVATRAPCAEYAAEACKRIVTSKKS